MKTTNIETTTYKEIREFYNSFVGEKCSYGCFRQRLYSGRYPVEEAILEKNRKQRQFQENVRDNGRICSRCGEFDTWENFTKESSKSTGHSSICRSCNKKRYEQYRSTKKGKQQIKNLKIICRSKLMYREMEHRKHAEWREKNADYDRERKKKWYYENKEAIRDRERIREDKRFAPGEPILYNRKKYRILAVKK